MAVKIHCGIMAQTQEIATGGVSVAILPVSERLRTAEFNGLLPRRLFLVAIFHPPASPRNDRPDLLRAKNASVSHPPKRTSELRLK